MKEFALSLLSRGCSHVVQTDGSSQCGRLEVCFEPEDYFNWKSQPPLLRLSSSGRLLSGPEPTPPKTYSTRRGPLILYSEDFALSTRQPEKVSKKEKAFKPSREEADGQLHTLQDLTEAALAYGVKQARAECPTTILQPLFSLPKQTTKHLQLPYNRTEEKWNYVTPNAGEEREEYVGQLNFTSIYRPVQVRYQPRFMCWPQPRRPPPGPLPAITPKPAPRCSVDGPHLAPGQHASFKSQGQEDHPFTRDRNKAEVRIHRVQMSPIPESDAWEECTEQQDDQKVTELFTGCSKDLNTQWKQSSIEKGGEENGCSQKTANMDFSLGGSHLLKVFNDRKNTEEPRPSVQVKQNHAVEKIRKRNAPFNPKCDPHHLPPIRDVHPLGSDQNKQELKTGNAGRENRNETVPRLPDIHQPKFCTETTTPRVPERPLVKQALVFPLLPERQDSLHGLPGEMEDVLHGEVDQKRESIKREESRNIDDGCRLNAAEKDLLICFEPDEDKEHEMTLGPLPPFVGRRGLGKQCSMALFRQDPCDPADQSESGIIRGSLPLELRECQKGGVLGTLIMGPAGEIIRLSFWDSLTDTEDHPAQEDAIREHVLRVMTSQGVLEQPWTILLDNQTSQTGEINETESKAKQDHKEQFRNNREDRASAEHIKAAEMVERTNADLGRIREAQGSLHGPAHLYKVCAPEKRSEKINHMTENLPYSKDKDIRRQIRGRTQSQQPKRRGTPGSPNSTSTISPQKTDLPDPRSRDEHLHTQDSGPQTLTRLWKENVNTQERSRKPRKDHVYYDEDAQIRKRKKKAVDQSIKETTEETAENKRAQSNTDTESQDTSFTTETSPNTTVKTSNKISEMVNKESINSQNHVRKAKKNKGQAAFVVGKPKQSQKEQQTEKRAYSSNKPEKKEVNVKEDDPTNDYSNVSPGHTGHPVNVMDNGQVFQENHKTESSLNTDPVLQGSTGARPSPCPDEIFISRESCVSRQDDDGQVSDCQESYSYAVSIRSHSSVSKPSTAAWSYHRTSVRTDSAMCSPEPFSRSNVSPCCAVPTHRSASHPAKSESVTDVKVSNEVIIARDRRAAALAEKAERRRKEVEQKRKEKEDEGRRQQEREEREDKMRLELEEDQRNRTEQAKLRKLQEEDEKQRQVKKELEREQRERAEMERERRQQEEKRRLVERIQKQRREEEARRAAKLKHQQQEEEARQEEEWSRLQEMDESERMEYLRRRKEEEEDKRRTMEERRRAEKEAAVRAEEEARLLAELFTRQRAELEKQLQFHRGLLAEAEGLEQTQDISRPWVFSYFTLLKMLGLTDCNAI